jgi:hypothetical protein
MKERLSASSPAVPIDIEGFNGNYYTRDAAELARFGKREQLKVRWFAWLFFGPAPMLS